MRYPDDGPYINIRDGLDIYLKRRNTYGEFKKPVYYYRIKSKDDYGKYKPIFRSLKTREESEARDRALKTAADIEYRVEQNLPLRDVSAHHLIRDFVQRQKDRAGLGEITSQRADVVFQITNIVFKFMDGDGSSKPFKRVKNGQPIAFLYQKMIDDKDGFVSYLVTHRGLKSNTIKHYLGIVTLTGLVSECCPEVTSSDAEHFL